MRSHDSFFQPYAEYRLETALSEEELKAVFAKEFPPGGFFAETWAAGCENQVTIFRRRDPFVLSPVLHGSNALRGDLFLRCTPTEDPSGKALHITIAPPRSTKWMFRIMTAFCLVGAAPLALLGMWQAVFPLLMAGALLLFLTVCRSMAEREISEIRRAFEGRLRDFEKNCHEQRNGEEK